ncbi:hypothetical protein CSUB8523_1009 [Campylobacter subantarcticus LMG 24377]|uniref:Uncharacterized protein n=1 Tax=Campylobacter subantarcticus TaxID=497724 RepID=A0ABW9N6X4_9BACT|nr:hypothetical protein [Campylobacter subantarcticus]AJC92522.1 hypothetical protein CSUB8523_1009 [Campylobacter subantarcticus LMG 24377]EAL3939476.1 hypothetical protein [Campylobacter lari]MPB99998.1 hypothetical protein [Campylobacter subantarcticus]
MSFSKISYVKKLFSIYVKYLQIDLTNSLLNSNSCYRNIDIIIILKDVFNMLYQSDEILEKKKDKIDNLLKEIRKLIEEYDSLKEIKKADLDFQKIEICDDKLIADILEDEELIELNAHFMKANRIFRNYFNGKYIEEKVLEKFSNKSQTYECYLFIQPLLEANNALSHLAIYIYNNGEKENELKNIDKAKSHLYRGAIDYYKMFIRFSIEKSKINKDNIFASFCSIRKQEFLSLGKNLMEKDIKLINPETGNEEMRCIFEAYRKLFVEIKNDLDLQKSALKL